MKTVTIKQGRETYTGELFEDAYKSHLTSSRPMFFSVPMGLDCTFTGDLHWFVVRP